MCEAWAEIPECVEAGTLNPIEVEKPSGTFALELGSVVIGALIASGAGLTKDLILILVKRALDHADAKRSEKAALKTKVYTRPDPETGLPIIHVVKGED